MNKRGGVPAFIEMALSMIKYGAICMQTQFTPWEVKRKVKSGKGEAFMYSEEERRALTYHGDFNWLVELPSSVYPVWTKNKTLRSVLQVGICTLYDLQLEYGKDAIKDVKGDKDDISSLRDTYVSKFNYMDAYCRVQWFSVNGSDSTTIQTGGEAHELMRQEHNLGFLPWVIVDFGQPLLKGIADAGIYEHLALLRAVMMSKWLAVAADKDTVVQALNPDNPNIHDDENNPAGERVVDLQTNITRLQPHQVDPQLMAAYQMLQQQLVESASARALIAIESFIGGNTPASSINAAQSTAIAQLGQVQLGLQNAIAHGLHQMLRWMEVSQEYSVGFRMAGIEGGDTAYTGRGAQFKLASPDTNPAIANVIPYSPDMVHINVVLRPTFISDKQMAFTQAQLEQQAGVSRKTSLERAGIDNPDFEKEQTITEALEGAMVQAKTTSIVGMAQMQLQQAQMQMQMQAQQQAQPQEGSPNPQQQIRDSNAGAFQPTQGMDGRFGAPSPAEVVPGENRVQMNGADDTGRQLV
jgi:hypothetical protein